MNIDKVIFKIKDKQYNAVKCYGYKYLTNLLIIPLINHLLNH